MKGFIGLTKRNLLIFFKDKQSVVFSLLTSIIVLALYLLFLKGTFADGIKGIVDEYEGLANLINDRDLDMFANLVLLTGILGSAMITVPYNSLTAVVRDREQRIDYDILATPIKRGRIIVSYFASASISSIILTGLILTVGLTVVGMQGKLYMGAGDIAMAYLIVALGSVSSTALFLIVVLFFKTTSASGAFFGILSAAAGFVIGAYIPISTFSGGVQTVCNIFPASQITIILRNFLMNGILDNMNSCIGGIDNGMFAEAMRYGFTFKAHMFGWELGVKEMILYVVAGIVVCVAAEAVIYSKTYKKK